MKIYIDIDGVILEKNGTIPDYGVEFISFLTTYHDCYWLTTHCRGGSNRTIDYLSKYYSEASIECLKTIQQTDWTTLKTEAIDFKSDFIWLDDYPFESEKIVLQKNHKIKALIVVDLNIQNELKRVQKEIELISDRLKTIN